MLLILDAYNILKAGEQGGGDISEPRRRHFIAVVAAYAKLKHHDAHIVFDGGEYGRPTTFWHEGVQVTYAGWHETADDIILQRLEKENPQAVILVSSDRELVDFARELNIVAVESVGFFDHMKREIAGENSPKRRMKSSSAQIHKREGHESSPELDALMEQGSCRLIYKDDDRLGEADLPAKGKKKSKEERRLEQVAKKL